jgi:hypothetical protein
MKPKLVQPKSLPKQAGTSKDGIHIDDNNREEDTNKSKATTRRIIKPIT